MEHVYGSANAPKRLRKRGLLKGSEQASAEIHRHLSKTVTRWTVSDVVDLTDEPSVGKRSGFAGHFFVADFDGWWRGGTLEVAPNISPAKEKLKVRRGVEGSGNLLLLKPTKTAGRETWSRSVCGCEPGADVVLVVGE